MTEQQQKTKRRTRYLVTAISPSGNPFSSAFDALNEKDAIRKFRDWVPGAYMSDQPITARLSKWQWAMTEEQMKELIFSLAWCDASSYHSGNAKMLLKSAYPNADFSKELNEFVKCKAAPPGEGCPR